MVIYLHSLEEIWKNRNRIVYDRVAMAGVISAASAFAFGSCKEGWYYRCIGVDP
ncbi:unnamed protein product [Dovyalis caffra]|uniref:Uncharacterized protein n=1 Tax=Dovyalis caffra TaxID=77055 RepID=A0AAV1R134_9ROSI|nr:unnamed protein product [Dovyalis caffra]